MPEANIGGSDCRESAPFSAAARLRAIRKFAGLSQYELADRLGIHRLTIGKVERGQSPLSVDLAVRIAATLGIDASEFLPGPAARVLRVRVVSRFPVMVQPAGPGDRALWAEVGVGSAAPMTLDFLVWFAGRGNVALFVEPVDSL